MNQERFRFALERLDETSWSDFERIASTFLVSDFPDLRTVASASGDGGRDSELFSPESDPAVLLQYSVTEGWSEKIRKTAKRIAERSPALLIYVSNQRIGALADDLKRKILATYRFRVDVLDRDWFVERVNLTREREEAAEELARKHVDPFLQNRDVFKSKAVALSSDEAKAAFTYLGLQWEDDTQEKGLTKIAFEALVCSVLHGTSSENRLPHAEILRRVRLLLPTHAPTEVDQFANAALARMAKRRVRHWKALDEFCLSHEERLRLGERLVARERQEKEFLGELSAVAVSTLASNANGAITANVEISRRVLERFLYERGEQFASSARTGTYEGLQFDRLPNLVANELTSVSKPHRSSVVEHAPTIVERVLQSPGPAVQAYLRTVADSYTLFAFLRETSDIQSVVEKMFADGDIWLDTTIILPVLAETLMVGDEDRRLVTKLLRAASDAGLHLHVTDGILEEVERHMNRALICSRTAITSWSGSVPFLYSMFVALGNDPSRFSGWLDSFRGDSRPLDDIADYLKSFYDIDRVPLTEIVERAPELLRQRVQALWQKVHDDRRDTIDQLTAQRLAAHDTETYVGIRERRRSERDSPFGFNSWLLTLDRRAYGVDAAVRDEFKEALGSPLMSPDFLSNYLSFGPIRRRLSKDTERTLPIIIDPSILATLPREILEVAERTREESRGLPDYRIQREVRDAVDRAKRRSGPIVRGGLQAVATTIVSRPPS